jgi:hypothetical protein
MPRSNAHDESEQRLGFYAMMEDDLALPFATLVLGVEVTVERINLTEADEIVATCARGRTSSYLDHRAAAGGTAASRRGVDRGVPPVGPLFVGDTR